MGLSPLTRGNRGDAFADTGQRGPIPAHAGQPRRASGRSAGAGAYPRSRGATVRAVAEEVIMEGLSPLTRGNRPDGARAPDQHGPIPAHAGQPTRAQAPSRTTWAYPRSRGATYTELKGWMAKEGLSPLTRGNPRQRNRPASGAGPIPAHAGQPHCGSLAPRQERAYPRSRGATPEKSAQRPVTRGLSPLTRGNHGDRPLPHCPLGPIPAHAGQP